MEIAFFETRLEKQWPLLLGCADHRNKKEGIAAFLKNRKPLYT